MRTPAALRRDAHRPAAGGGDRSREGVERGGAKADRLCVVRSGDARPRRGRAGARKGLRASRGGNCEHVPAYYARRVDSAVRKIDRHSGAYPPSASCAVPKKKGGREAAFFGGV